MTKKVFLLMYIACVAASCARLPKIDYTDRDFEIRLEHGGNTREALLHDPGRRPGRKLPLLIALHGGGGKAVGTIRLTEQRFNELSDQYGFLVVYPQGLGKSWNDEREDPISFAHKNQIDDVGFFKKLIETMVQDYGVDPERVFITGISNGGFMSIRVSRELVAQVKGVAVVTASIPLVAKQAHLDAPSMNVMLINGTEDPLVPYAGGEVQVLGRKRGKILSTDETIEIFKTRNRCAEEPEKEVLADNDPKDGTQVIRYQYDNKETGNKVVLLQIRGGGHTWPGGWQYLAERHIGRTSRDINACDQIWSFFSSLK